MSGTALLLVNLCATLFLTGLAWFLQVVHLPLMLRANKSDFGLYAKTQRTRNTALMAGPMLIEMITAVWLWTASPAKLSNVTLSHANLFHAFLLLAIVWIVTFASIVPLHARLVAGYDEPVIRLLIRRNWIRTGCWTLRSAIMIWIAAGAMHI